MKSSQGDQEEDQHNNNGNNSAEGEEEADSMETGAAIPPLAASALPNNASGGGVTSSIHSSRRSSQKRTTPRISNTRRGGDQQQQQQQQSLAPLNTSSSSQQQQQQLLTTSPPLVQNTPMATTKRREDRYPSGGAVGGGGLDNASNASYASSSVAAYSPPRLTPAAAAAQRAAASRGGGEHAFAEGSIRNPISPQSYNSWNQHQQHFHYQDDHTSTEGSSTISSSVYHLHQREREDTDIRRPSPKHRQRLNKWYFQKRLPLVMSASHDSFSTRGSGDNDESSSKSPHHPRSLSERINTLHTLSSNELMSFATINTRDTRDMDLVFSDAEDDYLKTKQSTAVLSIGLTCIQLLILCLQLAMCGIANLDINPFVGPFPDAFSEWGGKNPYLMVVQQEWWRLVSPSLLHVGILHLLANAFCQLEPVALFEREWGSARWLILYLVSSVACQAASSLVDPNTIAVGSSGALMGLFAAKLAQVLSHLLFEVHKQNQDEVIRLDQLSSVICGLILVSLLSFFTYIDWSGHMGGLAGGFFSGMVLFCNPIRSRCWKIVWMLLGLAGLASGFAYVFYSLLTETEFDAEIADACEYFRSLFPEGYECGCLWQQ